MRDNEPVLSTTRNSNKMRGKQSTKTGKTDNAVVVVVVKYIEEIVSRENLKNHSPI